MNVDYEARPRIRLLIDVLLALNALLFALRAGTVLGERVYIITAGILNGVLILVWFALLRPFLGIRIENGKITGPSLFFKRRTIYLRRIDIRHTLEYIPKAQFWGYRDIWSHQGERIRIYKRLIGRLQGMEIIKIIKDHPFREGEPSRIGTGKTYVADEENGGTQKEDVSDTDKE